MSPRDGSLRWALSPLDFQAHAVTALDGHPIGVLIAPCGHRLPMVVELDSEPPGAPCPECATVLDAQSYLASTAHPPPDC